MNRLLLTLGTLGIVAVRDKECGTVPFYPWRPWCPFDAIIWCACLFPFLFFATPHLLAHIRAGEDLHSE